MGTTMTGDAVLAFCRFGFHLFDLNFAWDDCHWMMAHYLVVMGSGARVTLLLICFAEVIF